MMNCTNCGQPRGADFCPNCEQFRDRLERLRVDQRERRRRLKPRGYVPAAAKRPGVWWMQLLRGTGGATAVSGQDAALPVGDRDLIEHD